MNLVKFLIFGAILSTIFGEFGHFPFGSSTGAVSISDLCLSLAILFFLIWKVVTKSKIQVLPTFKIILLFWGVGLLSLLYSVTVFAPTEVAMGSLYLIRFVIYSSLLLIVSNLKREKVLSADQLVKVLFVVGFGATLLGFAQLLILPNLESPEFLSTSFGFDAHQGRLTGTFLDPNFAGAYLVLTLGSSIYLLLKNPKSIWLKISTATILMASILTFSRSAYLMLLVFLITWGIERRISFKRWVLIGTVTVVAVTVAFLTVPRFHQRLVGAVTVDDSAGQRIESWQKGWEVFKTSPIIGVGFDNFRSAQEHLNLFKTYSQNGGHAGAGVDSSALLVLATTGILGLSIFLLFWAKVIQNLFLQKEIFPKILLALIFGIFVESQFINSLFFPAVMLWYFSALGYFLKD